MADILRVGVQGQPERSALQAMLQLLPFLSLSAAVVPSALESPFFGRSPLASQVPTMERGTVSPSQSSSRWLGICAGAWTLQKELAAWRWGEAMSDGGTGTFTGWETQRLDFRLWRLFVGRGVVGEASAEEDGDDESMDAWGWQQSSAGLFNGRANAEEAQRTARGPKSVNDQVRGSGRGCVPACRRHTSAIEALVDHLLQSSSPLHCDQLARQFTRASRDPLYISYIQRYLTD